jgi:hypothetical protein
MSDFVSGDRVAASNLFRGDDLTPGSAGMVVGTILGPPLPVADWVCVRWWGDVDCHPASHLDPAIPCESCDLDEAAEYGMCLDCLRHFISIPDTF